MAGWVTAGAPSRFHNPVRIHFGAGALDALPETVANRRCLVLTTEGMARRGTLARVEDLLAGLVTASYTGVVPNPTILSCQDAADAVGDVDAEVIVALGGGSAIDTAKGVAAARAVAALRGGPGFLSAHLRDGEGFPDGFTPPPILAVPTTAGTGSEVTMWATIWDEQMALKRSISHSRLYPEAALLDPVLTVSVPRITTAASALDALSHAMEAIWNREANPVSDALAVRALGIIPAALRRALESPADLPAREALLTGSLLAGLAMSNTRTALAHSISYPLTAELELPHGFACSMTLAEILHDVDERVPERAALIVGALGAESRAEAMETLYELFRAAGTPDEVVRHIPDEAALGGLRASFIAPGRAENFVLPADQAYATELLHRAYRTLSGSIA